jgi:integrase
MSADAYAASRIDVSPTTREHMNGVLKRLNAEFGETPPDKITPEMVQAWITGNELKPSSVRSYVGTLRRVLDYAKVDPNPARDPNVRLPQARRVEVEPPSAADVESILANVPPRWRLAIRTLAETGMRASEVCDLEWRDVDEAGSRFRIRNGKTAAARRWVAVPEDLMVGIAAATPPDDRAAERRVFIGATRHVFKNIMSRACKSAGIAHYHPHDLRHRYASVQILRGVPVTEIAAHLGHARKSMTLDTYSHVLLSD